MKRGKNIYTADDILFKLAHVALVLNIFPGMGLWYLVAAGTYTNRGTMMAVPPELRIALGIIMPLLPLSCYLAAFLIRTRERRIIAVWSNLDALKLTDLRRLAASMNIGEKKILEALAVINNSGGGYFVYSADTGLITDGRLDDTQLVVGNCPACGGEINMSVSLMAKETPRCAYCGVPVIAGDLDGRRREAVDRLKKEDSDGPGAVPGKREMLNSGRREINVPLLILLIFLCWPAAIIYVTTR